MGGLCRLDAECFKFLNLMHKYRYSYPPGCKVLRWMRPNRGTLQIIIHDRVYYEGQGDEADLRCETWGQTSREFVKTMPAMDIVGAFVPLPGQ